MISKNLARNKNNVLILTVIKLFISVLKLYKHILILRNFEDTHV